MIGIILLARHVADALGISLDASVAEMCRTTGASRPSVYEQAGRVLASVLGLAERRQGRPTGTGSPAEDGDAASSLTIDVLSFRLEHPGSAVPRQRRTVYSPAFLRFILERFDTWSSTHDAFARAARLPLDTLNDWLRADRAETLAQPEPKPAPVVPVDASEIVRQIAVEWQRREGPTRPFLTHAAATFSLSTAQVRRVLSIIGAIKPRSRRPFRHRGEGHRLSPGMMLVTDGKRIDIELSGSGRRIHLNWQAMADQATGCDTAVVVSDEEDAAAVTDAFGASLVTLGGVVPDALLHDNKPIYDDASLKESIASYGTTMIAATPGRPENKAGVEGAFGLFEQRVGPIRLDDTSKESLIHSAVREALRTYTAATNAVPRIELHGHSRAHTLQSSCPSYEQQQRDRVFLARLSANHQTPRWQREPDPTTLRLLDSVFERLGLLGNDQNRSLRRYLARYEPAAIRRAHAVVAPKLERGDVDLRWAHRYLVKVIQNQQDLLDLEHAQNELLGLCRIQNQDWVRHEQAEYGSIVSNLQDPQLIAVALAENAAHGGIPVKTAFWSEKLLEFLHTAPHQTDAAVKHLVRLFEAPHQNRLALIDLVIAHQHGVA